jgi:hypothetical protein
MNQLTHVRFENGTHKPHWLQVQYISGLACKGKGGCRLHYDSSSTPDFSADRNGLSESKHGSSHYHESA